MAMAASADGAVTPMEGDLFGALDAPAVRGLVRLSAPTLDQTLSSVQAVAWKVTKQVLDAHCVEPPSGQLPWSIDAFAYPSGSTLAQMNCRIR